MTINNQLRLTSAITDLELMLDWSDRLGSDEIHELERIIKELKKLKEH